jgi:hypothetical protein
MRREEEEEEEEEEEDVRRARLEKRRPLKSPNASWYARRRASLGRWWR